MSEMENGEIMVSKHCSNVMDIKQELQVTAAVTKTARDNL